MANEKPADDLTELEEGHAAKPSKLPLMVAAVNTLAILTALVVVLYTQVLFKRPAITEKGERARLAGLHKKPKIVEDYGQIDIKPFTVNIRPTPRNPQVKPGPGSQVEGKTHYATVGMTLEIRDQAQTERFERIRPVFLDEVIQLLSKKEFYTLTNVQGRFLFRSELMDLANKLLKEKLITNVFFTQFIIQ